MALDKDILGLALYNKANEYNETEIADIELSRISFWKAIAEEVINHFKTNGELAVPGVGLVAPVGGGPVTGSSVTGKIS